MTHDAPPMWGYQEQFQESAQRAASGVFDRLDDRLRPKVFLVGILTDHALDHPPICVEPPDCGYEPDLFADVKDRARQLEEVDEERHILRAHPVAQDIHLRRLELRAFKNAVQTAIRREDGGRGVLSFCSWPKRVEDYMVCVALQLRADVYRSYYALSADETDGGQPASVSLLDAVVTEYLDGCSEALRKPFPGSERDVVGGDAEEILRAAGKRLMLAPARAAESGEEFHGLFHACDMLSSETGAMLIARRGHPNLQVALSLASPVPLTDYPAARRLLAASSADSGLLSDSVVIYGFGRVFGLYDEREEDLFRLSFAGRYTWELGHGEHTLMRVTSGLPRLPQLPLDKAKFRAGLTGRVPGVDPKDVERLWALANEAAQRNLAATIVVSDDAPAEAERLARQSVRVEPVSLSFETLRMAVSLGGAALVDAQTACYAIGVALDGVASDREDPARGTPYNTAVRYIEGKRACVAILITEQGEIALAPEWAPPGARLAIVEE